MSDPKNALQATVEDYFSDGDNVTPRPRRSTRTSKRRASRSKPPPSVRRITPPDTESVDSGYSSKTAATQNSRDSAYSSRKPRPISLNVTPTASLSRPRSSSVGAQIFSKPDARPHYIAEPAPASHFRDSAAPLLAMDDSIRRPCPGCERCIAHHNQRPYSIARPSDTNYATFYLQHASLHQPQPLPAVSFPPSSFAHPAPPSPRRTHSGGLPRPRPLSYHDQRPRPAVPVPLGYPPPGPTDPYYRPATVASGPAYLPPPQSYAQPLPSPTSLRRPIRPQITHYETERPTTARPTSMYGSAMVSYPYRPTPPGQLQAPSRSERRRRSTSPMIQEGLRENNREIMPPPPPPRSAYTEAPTSLSRDRSIRRRRESETRHGYPDDGHDYQDWDSHETIKASRMEPPRPSVLPDTHQGHSYSSYSTPSIHEVERSRSRRESYAGPKDLEARTNDAESYIARTSNSARDPLTAEAVKQVDRKGAESNSRSRKSERHSQGPRTNEHEGPPSHVSKGGTKLQIRAGEDDSWEVEGDMTGHSIRLVPQEGGGRPQMIIDGASGRETRYYKDGSRASKTSNKSFASRAGRTAKASDSGRAGRKTSLTGNEERRNSEVQVSSREA